MAKDQLWPEEAASPLGEVFSPDTQTLPGIVVVDDIAALQVHMRDGTLDLEALERRYGKQCWVTKKVLLPVLDDPRDGPRVFHMEGAVIQPPRRV